MKKVLVISYFYPPFPAVGGLRLKGLVDRLPEQGWEATVVTRRLPREPDGSATVIQTDYEHDLNDMWSRGGKNASSSPDPKQVVKRSSPLKRTMGAFVAYPDAQRNWYRKALNAGKKVLDEGDFDLILSSSPPQTGHMVAKRLKALYDVPWVADLRDLWTLNHYYLYGDLRRKFEKGLELRTLRTADSIVTVSPFLAEQMGKLHGRDSVAVIPNGFNPDEMNPEPKKIAPRFTLAFTGTMYEGLRGPDMLFDALAELRDAGSISSDDLRVRLLGPICDSVLQRAKELNLLDIVHFEGVVERKEALEAQRTSHGLILLFSNDPIDKHVCSAKFYEYLAAMRPVIAFGKYRGDCADILEKNGLGFQVTNKDEARSKLLDLIHQPDRSIPDDRRADIIRTFDQKAMASSFANLMDEVAGRQR